MARYERQQTIKILPLSECSLFNSVSGDFNPAGKHWDNMLVFACGHDDVIAPSNAEASNGLAASVHSAITLNGILTYIRLICDQEQYATSLGKCCQKYKERLLNYRKEFRFDNINCTFDIEDLRAFILEHVLYNNVLRMYNYTLQHYNPDYHPEIYTLFNYNCVNTHITYKPNEFYYHVVENYRRSKRLFVAKIKNIVRVNLHDKVDNVLNIISNMLIVPKRHSLLELNSQWFLNFTSVHIFFVDFREECVRNDIICHLKQIKKNILRFAKSYYAIKKMTHAERVEYRRSMEETFTEHIKSHFGQCLIADYGYSAASEVVYREKVLPRKHAYVDLQNRYQIAERSRVLDHNRMLARDNKIARNNAFLNDGDEFTCQSKRIYTPFQRPVYTFQRPRFDAYFQGSDSDSDVEPVESDTEPSWVDSVRAIYRFFAGTYSASSDYASHFAYSVFSYSLLAYTYSWIACLNVVINPMRFIFNKINNFIKVTKVLSRINAWFGWCYGASENPIKRAQKLFTPVNGKYTDGAKLCFMQCYNVINGLVDCYRKDHIGCLRWLAPVVLVNIDIYELFSESMMNDISCVMNLSFCAVTVPITYAEKVYNVTRESLMDMVASYNRGERVDSEVKPEAFAPQNFSMLSTPLLNMFSNALSTNKLSSLEPWEIAQMNQQFVFMNHESRRFQDKAAVIYKVIAMITRYFFLYDSEDSTYMEFTQRLIASAKFITDVQTRKNDMDNDEELCWQVLEEYDIATEIYMHPYMATIAGRISANYSNLYRTITTLAITAKHLVKNHKKRMPPLCVFFTGEPLTGKTFITNELMRAVHYELKRTALTDSDIFNWPSNPKYMDGYNQQWAVLADDIWMSTIKEDRAAESVAIVQMVNDRPFNMNMAEVTDKGRTEFHSEFLFMSSNKMNSGIDNTILTDGIIGATDPNAITRRFHIVIHAYKKIDTNHPPSLEDMRFELHRCAFARESMLHKKPNIVKKIKRRCYNCEGCEKGQKCRDDYGYPRYTFPELVMLVYTIRKRQLNLYKDSQISHDDLIKKLNNHTYDPTLLSMLEEVDATDPFLLSVRDESDPTHNTVPSRVLENVCQNAPTHIKQQVPVSSMKFIENLFSSGLITMNPDYERYLINFFLYASVFVSSAIGGYSLLKMVKSSIGGDSDNSFSTQSHPGNGKGPKKPKPKPNVKDNHLVVKSNEDHICQSMTKVDVELSSITDVESYSDEFSSQGNFRKSMQGVMGCMLRVGCCGYDTHGVKAQSACVGFHLRNGAIMIPVHFFLPLLELKDKEMFIRNADRVQKVAFPSEYKYYEYSDLLVFKINDKIDLPPSGYKYLFPDTVNVQEGAFIELLTMSGLTGCPYSKKATLRPGSGEITYSSDLKEDLTFIIVCPFRYDCTPLPVEGDSGGLVVVITRQGTCAVVGMHCGINLKYDYGFCMHVTQKLVNGLMCESWKTQSEFKMNECPLTVSRTVIHNSPLSRKNTIVRVLNDWDGPPLKVPVSLKYTDDYIPEYVAMRKLRQEHFPYREGLINEDVYDFLDSFYPQVDDRDFVRCLTIEEAVCWTYKWKGKEFVNSICATSGRGYFDPHLVLSGKSEYIERVNEKYKLRDLYVPRFNQLLTDLLEYGKLPDILWQVCLKMERRTKTVPRLFTACPFDCLLLMRALFLPFVVYITMVDGPCDLGINVHSNEWRYKFFKLRKTAESVISGDYSNWDGSVPRFVGEVVLNFINRWFNDDEKYQIARRKLFEHIYNANYVLGHNVYNVKDGNPSGNPLTTVYNSLCNLVIMYVTLNQLDVNCDSDHTTFAVYGDDVIVTTTKPGINVWDMSLIIKRDFGMTFTHWTKEENRPDRPADKLEDINYLSRAFVEEKDGSVSAPLPLTTVTHMTYWVRKNDHNKFQNMLSTAQSFFIELSHHPPEVYKEKGKAYLDALRKTYRLDEHAGFIEAAQKLFRAQHYYKDRMYKKGDIFIDYSFRHSY